MLLLLLHHHLPSQRMQQQLAQQASGETLAGLSKAFRYKQTCEKKQIEQQYTNSTRRKNTNLHIWGLVSEEAVQDEAMEACLSLVLLLT